jgi:hypothetical protein
VGPFASPGAKKQARLIAPTTLKDTHASRLIPNLKIVAIDQTLRVRKRVSIVRSHNKYRRAEHVSLFVQLIGSVDGHLGILLSMPQ